MKSKSLYLLPVLFLLLVASAGAQTMLGVYAGPNFSTVAVDPELDHEGSTALTGGISLTLPLAGSLSLAVQPGWLQKASTATGAVFFGDVDFKADFITLPIMLRYSFGEDALRPYLTAGASVDILMSAEQKLGDKWYDIKDDVESTDISLNIGAGVMYLLGENALSLELRYMHGIPNLNKNKGQFFIVGTGSDYDVMSRSLTVTAAYSFAI